MFAERCPLGESEVFDDGTKCEDVTKDMCKTNAALKIKCCVTCALLTATPWLGPNCTNGDSVIGCHTLNTREKCITYKSECCETCCSLLGADTGYSCLFPTETTVSSVHRTTQSTIEPTKGMPSSKTTTKAGTAKFPASTTALSASPELRTTQKFHRNLLFRVLLRIIRFEQTEFDCDDPDLQDQKSATYLYFNVSNLPSYVFSKIYS